MLQSFQIVLLATLAASFLYWAAPVAFVRAKRALLLGVSALLIFVSSPKALLLALPRRRVARRPHFPRRCTPGDGRSPAEKEN